MKVYKCLSGIDQKQIQASLQVIEQQNLSPITLKTTTKIKNFQLKVQQPKMCFDIATYTLGCSCRIYEGNTPVAIRTSGCKHATSHPDKPTEICDPLLNGRIRETIPSLSPGVSCVVHNMLIKRGDDPNTLAPFVHQDLASFIEIKAYHNDDDYKNFRRMAQMELKTKIMLDRYVMACQATNPRKALEELEDELDFEKSTIEEPRRLVKAAVPEYLESVGK